MLLLRSLARSCVVAGAVSACGCGADHPVTSPTAPGTDRGASLGVAAAPDPVAAGALLRYDITVRFAAPVAPSVTIHLPPGATEVDASGAGWVCTQTRSAGDRFESGDHVDLVCASALASMAAPPIRVGIRAPSVPGRISTCIEFGKSSIAQEPACFSSTVS
jgi:hypothetical protein